MIEAVEADPSELDNLVEDFLADPAFAPAPFA